MQSELTLESPQLESKFSFGNNAHSLQKPSNKLSSRAKLKLITSSCMNDTFANWRKKKKKTVKTHQTQNIISQATDQDLGLPLPSEKNHRKRQLVAEVKGMTLEEYFRVRSSSETRHHQQTSLSMSQQPAEEDECEQTNNYLKQTFEINETDEDNYNESQKSVRTPEFSQAQPANNDVQKKLIDKYSKKNSKLKTETQEDEEFNFADFRNKTRFPTMSTEDKDHSEEKDDCRKNRVISHPNSKPLGDKRSFQSEYQKYEGDYKKSKILEKVKQEKDRIHDIKVNEMGYVTKYASKFHINEAVCKQIFKDCRI